MNLFDKLVGEALKNQPDLSPLRIVVEKELLHHDILGVLSSNNFLKNLTFIGGTALRTCYGSIRLSEDLDFTGGADFSKESLSKMGEVLISKLNQKYGLLVEVAPPIKDKQNVDTWKIKIQTKPMQKHLPSQHINIDICAINSYEKRPMMLLNPYGVDMGTNGLVIQAQSKEEIYTDKLLAFAFRPNRIKYRDLWDITWLHGQGLKPRFELIAPKLEDRKTNMEYFLSQFGLRKKLLDNNEIMLEFKQEMVRFLPIDQVNKSLNQEGFWSFITYLIDDLDKQIRKI